MRGAACRTMSLSRLAAIVLPACLFLLAGCHRADSGEALQAGAERSPAAAAGAPDSGCDAVAVKSMLEAWLADIRGRNPVPGASAAIASPSRWQRPIAAAVGVADLDTGSPLTVGHRFLVGSVGKTFFASLALALWSEGSLDLERPIGAYLPGLELPAAERVSVRMLLDHTSGYGEYDHPFMESLVGEPLRRREPEDWLGVIRRGAAPESGATRYSDLNYILLAMVLDRASGGTAYEAIETRFLGPLGLAATSPADQPTIDGLAAGYAGESGLFGADKVLRDGRLIYNPQFEWGGGGFVSTPSDLAQWLAALGSGQVLSAEKWGQALARPASAAASADHWYGLGFHVDATPAGRAIGHSGYIPGYLSWVRWYPEAALAVAVEVNSSDSERVREDGFDWLDALARQVAQACAPAVAEESSGAPDGVS